MDVVIVSARTECASQLASAVSALGHCVARAGAPATVAIVDCSDGAATIAGAARNCGTVIAVATGDSEAALRDAYAAGATYAFPGWPGAADLRSSLIAIESRGTSSERRVAELEERFTKAFNFSPLASIITNHPARLVVEVNERFAELSGWSREELLGHNPAALGVWANPADRSAVLAAADSGQHVTNFVTQLRKRDGELRDIRLSQQEYEVGGARTVLTVVEDITESRSADAAIRRLSTTLAAQQEASLDGVLIVDASGLVMSYNRRYLDIWGLEPEDMVEGLGRREEVARRLLVDPESTIEMVRELYRSPGRQQHAQVEFTDGRTIETYTSSLIGGDGTNYGRAWYYRDVTERKAAEDALRASEERYRTLVDVSPNAVAVHQKRRLVYVNAAGLALLGMTREAFSGIDVFDLVHPDDRPIVLANAQQSRGDPLPQFVEARLQKPGGEWLTVELASVATSFDGSPATQTVIRDVTEQRRALDALNESEERYRTLVDLSPDPTIVQNEEGVLYANRAALKAIGATELTQVVGRDPALFIHRDDWKKARRRRDALRRGERPPVETQRMVRLDGEVREMEVVAVSVRFDGQWAAQVGFRDITERVRAEAERRALERKLLESQKLESLGVLAGGIAHDFNNLLVSIMGNAGLAAMEVAADSPMRPYLDEIETASQRAADLARQMLAYSGKGKFVISGVNLTAVVEEMGHLLRVSLPKRVALRMDLNRALSQSQADATQIRQIVMNLVLNAGEAIGDREGLISVTTGEIEAGPEDFAGCVLSPDLPSGRYVYLEIADTGAGMDEATQKRIFEPFFTTKFTGRGLGLAAVLGIVRGHKGALQVESTPGEGSRFRLMLPADRAANAPAAIAAAPSTAEINARILLVDDEEHVRTVAQRILERMGLSVVCASDGVEALELFEQEAGAISLVLLDLTMPGMSGAELTARIRESSPATPVVVMSGYSEESAATSIGDAGYAGFLQKPFTLMEVRKAVSTALGR